MTLGPLMIDVAGTELSAEDRELLAHPLVGSVILFTRNYADPQQLQGLVAQIHALRSPRLLVAVDHEGGRVQRFRNGFTALPPLRLIGHQFDLEPAAGLDLARRHGWLMASELLACGLDFSFAPCVDLDYGLSEIIGDRAFHSRAAAVGELAGAYSHGMRDAGLGAGPPGARCGLGCAAGVQCAQEGAAAAGGAEDPPRPGLASGAGRIARPCASGPRRAAGLAALARLPRGARALCAAAGAPIHRG